MPIAQDPAHDAIAGGAAPWIPDDSTLGARLALVRNRMMWNVKEAARECGIAPATWRSWEGGVEPRGVDELVRIAQRTGCDEAWLIIGPRRDARGEEASS